MTFPLLTRLLDSNFTSDDFMSVLLIFLLFVFGYSILHWLWKLNRDKNNTIYFVDLISVGGRLNERKLSNAAVSLFNSSSQNELPTSTIASVAGTSEVKISELLNTVNDNNATYYGLAEIVRSWQSWYKEQKEIFDKVQ